MKTTAKIILKADGKTYQANVNIPDDDGTTTLPMIAFDTIKRMANECPGLHKAKQMTMKASMS